MQRISRHITAVLAAVVMLMGIAGSATAQPEGLKVTVGVGVLRPDDRHANFYNGSPQNENTVVRMYPNPASNVLNIALEGSEVNEVVIIDIYGKTVVRNNVADGTNSLDISSLPAGMYFVQLRADNAVKATQKLIKR